MLDTFSKKTSYHLVVDQETFGILTTSASVAVANAVSKGIVNSSTMTIVLFGTQEKLFQYNKNTSINLTLIKQVTRANSATDSNLGLIKDTKNNLLFDIEDNSQVTEQWMAKRQLANDRQQGIISLETKLERYLSRVKTFTADDILYATLVDELKKCNVEQSQYSNAVTEWAEIVGIEPFAAYQELSVYVRSVGLSVLRLHALWTKYVDLINNLTTKQEILDCVNGQLEMELRAGSK